MTGMSVSRTNNQDELVSSETHRKKMGELKVRHWYHSRRQRASHHSRWYRPCSDGLHFSGRESGRCLQPQHLHILLCSLGQVS